jgi:DNA mismatch repair protein MutS
VQNDLFSVADEPEIQVIERIVEVEKDEPVLNLLRALDVDNLSPREALQQIYALKDALEA